MPDALILPSEDADPAVLWDDSTALRLAEETDWSAYPVADVAVAGARTLASFGDTGRPGLLALAVSLLEEAYSRADELTLPERADTALCLGEALREGSAVFDEPDWLPEAIDVGETAARLGDGAWVWFALCETYRHAFWATGAGAHLEDALRCARTAVGRALPEDAAALANNLGAVATHAADALGCPHLLDEALGAATSAVRRARRQDPHMPTYLANVAFTLAAVAERDRSPRVARRAVVWASRAVARDASSVSALLVGAECHRTLGELTHSDSALDEASELLARADVAARGTSRHPQVLLERSRSAQRAFDRTGDAEALVLAVRYAERAVALEGGQNRASADALLNLAVCRTRASEKGLGAHRTRAPRLAALALERAGLGGRLELLGDAALVWLSHHERTGSETSLLTAVELLREAAGAPGAPPRILSNLAGALLSAFDRDPSESVAYEATDAARRARAHAPAHGSDLALYDAVLASCLEASFQVSRDLEYLRESARHARHAGRRLDPRSPDATAIRTNCAVALRTSFEQRGVVSDLSLSLHLLEDAVASASPADRPTCLGHLAATLRTRSERTGDQDDLQRALSAAAELELCGATMTRAGAATISACRAAAYEATGELGELDAAVRWARTALGRRARMTEVRAAALTSLANALFTRFEVIGEEQDLTESLHRYRQAIRATPPGSPSVAGRMANLANALRTRASLGLGGATEALRTAEVSVQRAQPRDHNLPAYLSGLALVLSELGRHAEASRALRRAVAACPRSSPTRHFYRTNLAASLRDEYESGGGRRALGEAIRLLTDSPDVDAPWAFVGRAVLADCLRERDLPGDRDAAFRHWASVQESPNSPAWLRLTASKAAAESAATARPPNWPQAAAFYRRAVEFHERTAWHGLAWVSRRRFLAARPNLGVDAAASALQVGDPPGSALTLLESGRDLLWRGQAERRSIGSDHPRLLVLRRIADELDAVDRPQAGSAAQRLS